MLLVTVILKLCETLINDEQSTHLNVISHARLSLHSPNTLLVRIPDTSRSSIGRPCQSLWARRLVGREGWRMRFECNAARRNCCTSDKPIALKEDYAFAEEFFTAVYPQNGWKIAIPSTIPEGALLLLSSICLFRLEYTLSSFVVWMRDKNKFVCYAFFSSLIKTWRRFRRNNERRASCQA